MSLFMILKDSKGRVTEEVPIFIEHGEISVDTRETLPPIVHLLIHMRSREDIMAWGIILRHAAFKSETS